MVAGCDDPTASLEPPDDLRRAMAVLLVLDPAYTVQPLWIETADVAGDPIGDLAIDGVRVTVVTDRRTVLRAEPDTSASSSTCTARYAGVSFNSRATCVALEFRPTAGETYTITVDAPERPTATATTRVPGDFRVLEADARGDPPGTDRLSMRWSPSDGAHGYFVAFRPDSVSCAGGRIFESCFSEWYATTVRPEIETAVSDAAFERALKPWTLDVYALDRALYEYLTSGTGGELFAVPPVSNVEGGYGVVGSWIRRSWPLDP
ncbi:MAG: DUF4249 family protein [Gemmatimonadota bacterium]